MKTTIKNGKFLVQSDYCDEFVAAARRLSGAWKPPHWVFPEAAEPHVRAALLHSYGEDGTAEPERVQVEIKFLETHHGEKSSVSIGPVEIARAFGRDSGAKTAPNVLLLSGAAKSGGSVRNWRTTIEEGACVHVLGVPRLLANRLVAEYSTKARAISIIEPEPEKPAAAESERVNETDSAAEYAEYLEASAKEAAGKIFGAASEPAEKPTAKKPKKSRSSARAKNPKGPVSPTVMEELRRGEPEPTEPYGQAWGPEDLKKPAKPREDAATVKSVGPGAVSDALLVKFMGEYGRQIGECAGEQGIDAGEFVRRAVVNAIQLHLLDAQIMEGKRKGGFGKPGEGPREAGQSEEAAGPCEDGATAAWRPLTSEEAAVMAHFQALYGRRWRKTITDLWAFADPRDDNERVLYALRNSHGPSWLAQYKVKAKK